MPTVDSAIRMAKVMSSKRISLPISTWIDGVKSALARTRRSRKSLAAFAAHSVSISRTEVLITKSGVTRRPPITIAIESSAVMVGCSRPRMLSAAMVHADTATSR